jgi:hypothetical protein
MLDDSMAPTFVEGDVLTINYDLFEEPGDYMLVRSDDLLMIRRYTDRGDKDHFDFMPENLAYPAILDDGAPDPWGVVSAVQHIDGTIETFDLSTRGRLSELEKAMAPTVAFPAALHSYVHPA